MKQSWVEEKCNDVAVLGCEWVMITETPTEGQFF